MNTLSHKHNGLVLGGLCFLALIVGAWGYLIWNPATPKTPTTPQQEKLILASPIIGGTDPVRGSKIADITIVEFGDYFCPSCVDAHAAIQKLMKNNPRIRLIWKDMPNTKIHPLARNAAIAARCAGAQGKYWEFHDTLFERQDEIVDMGSLTLIAEELKLNKTSFDTCLASAITAQMIDLTIAEGVALNVDATPYFFIGKARGSFDKGDIEDAIQNYIP